MSTVIPSPLAGIGEAAALFRQIRERRAEREQEQERFDRQFSLQEQAQALSSLESIIPILPERPVAELPFLHDTIRKAFPGADPADVSPTGLGSLPLNRRNVQEIVAPLIGQRIEQLRREDPEQLNELLDLGIARELTGAATTEPGREARRTLDELTLQSLDSLKQNPDDILGRLGREVLGLPQQVQLRTPDGRMVTYDSAEEMRASLQLFNILTDAEIRRGELAIRSRQDRQDIAGELRDDFNGLFEDQGISISRAVAGRIINAVHAEDPQGAVNQLLDEEDARKAREVERLRAEGQQRQADLLARTPTPTQQALRFYTRGVQQMRAGVNAFFQQSPEAQAASNFIELGTLLGEFLPQEEVAEGVARLTPFLQDLGLPLPDVDPGLIAPPRIETETGPLSRRRPRPRTGERRQQPETQIDTLQDITTIIDQRISELQAPAGPTGLAPGVGAIMEGAAGAGAPGAAFDPAAMAEAQFRLQAQRVSQLIQGLASGQIDINQVRQVVGNDPALLAAIQRDARRLREGGGR